MKNDYANMSEEEIVKRVRLKEKKLWNRWNLFSARMSLS